PGCGLARPSLDIAVTELILEPEGVVVSGRLADGATWTSRIPQMGLHVAYDAALALAGAVALGVEPRVAAAAFEDVAPAWGRLDRFEATGRNVLLAFAKNPMSYR